MSYHINMPQKLPAFFVSDFGPMPAFEEDDYTKALGFWGKKLGKPKAIIAMSGHWDTGSLALEVSASSHPETIHDYSGFPREFYQKAYSCPGSPALARRVRDHLNQQGFEIRLNDTRGLDHGVWVPLSRLYPEADVPVVELSVPAGQDPHKIIQIGEILSPLREENILLLACGALIHNLGQVHFFGKDDPPDDWASEFYQWLKEKFLASNTDDLSHFLEKAPHARLAAPSPEHFDPLFFFLGAGMREKSNIHFDSIYYGNGLLFIASIGHNLGDNHAKNN